MYPNATAVSNAPAPPNLQHLNRDGCARDRQSCVKNGRLRLTGAAEALDFPFMTVAVETEALGKIFDKPQGWRRVARFKPVTAVNDVSLSVAAGELFGLLGPNGAGKTTLVKMLCTLIVPTSGTAVVAGHPLERGRAIRAQVGLVVTDERSFYWRLSARRNLLFFAAMHGLYGRAARERVDTVLDDVDLRDVAERRFSDFSSGMRQRLAIARGLLHRPQILFLDEPSRSLDPTATRRLHDLILEMKARQAMTVFLITHDLAEAEKLCDRVAVMHRGRIRTVGRPGDLRRHLQPVRHYALDTDPVDAHTAVTLREIVPGITIEAAPAGSRLMFRAGERDALFTAVVDCLRGRGLTIYSLEGVPPTLEEVFAHFTNDAL